MGDLKVLFDEDMFKSNRSFAITKLKNNIKTVDSFIFNEEKDLIILTSIEIFKFNLSNKFLTPTTKQSQGLTLAKLLPSEKIVFVTHLKMEKNLFNSKLGKSFVLIAMNYWANEFKLAT